MARLWIRGLEPKNSALTEITREIKQELEDQPPVEWNKISLTSHARFQYNQAASNR